MNEQQTFLSFSSLDNNEMSDDGRRWIVGGKAPEKGDRTSNCSWWNREPPTVCCQCGRIMIYWIICLLDDKVDGNDFKPLTGTSREKGSFSGDFGIHYCTLLAGARGLKRMLLNCFCVEVFTFYRGFMQIWKIDTDLSAMPMVYSNWPSSLVYLLIEMEQNWWCG